MDRFSGREADFQDDVPKNPMSKFVSSGTAAQPAAQEFGKIEIQASRREQRAQEAAAAPRQHHAGAIAPPVWVGQPPKGAFLRVLKDGAAIESIPLARPMTVFGRGQAADVVLDHQSLSRQHAAVCYQRMTGRWLVMDLGSVHGTLCEGKPVDKSRPAELHAGGELRLGGSSRVYILQIESATAPAEADKGRLSTAAAETRRRDEGDRAAGPRADDGPGKFAGLVQESVLHGPSSGPSSKKRKSLPADSPPRRPSAYLHSRKSGLYDNLPPVRGSAGP